MNDLADNWQFAIVFAAVAVAVASLVVRMRQFLRGETGGCQDCPSGRDSVGEHRKPVVDLTLPSLDSSGTEGRSVRSPNQ